MPPILRTWCCCLLALLLAAACGVPGEPANTAATGAPTAAPTIALPPEATATSSVPADDSGTEISELPQASELVPFPYLPAGQPVSLRRVSMADARRGWAIYEAENEPHHVLRTTDGGATWADVTPPEDLVLSQFAGRQPPYYTAAHFLDDDHAWVVLISEARALVDAIWRTSDGGATWERSPLGRRNYGSDGGPFFDFVDPQRGWALIDIFHGAGSHSGELFRTTDGGVTWERLPFDLGHASGIDFVDAKVGWITTDVFAGVFPPWSLSITQDGGITWETKTLEFGAPPEQPIPEYSQCDFRLLHALSTYAAVAYRPSCPYQDEAGQIHASYWLDETGDRGRTWLSLRIPGRAPEFLNADTGWVIGPSAPKTDFEAGPWTLFKTQDGGSSWRAVSELPWQGKLDFVDERFGWGTDEAGGLWQTSDGGVNWRQLEPRTTAGPAPLDTTITHALPAELAAISPANAPRLVLLASLAADAPTSVVIWRDTLFVGNARGQILSWELESPVASQPKVWWAHGDWIYDLAVLHDFADLVSAARDGTLRLWEVASLDGFWFELPSQRGEVLSVALSPDQTWLASGGQDTQIALHDLKQYPPAERPPRLTGHRGWIWDLAFSPDGSLLASASGDRTVRLWSVETAELLGTLEGHTSTVSQVAFSPDGQMLATGSWDGTARIWDVETLQPRSVLQGHEDWVLGMAFSPSGDLLISCSADGTVRMWDPATGELLRQLEPRPAPVRGVAFDNLGRFLVSVGGEGQVQIWGVRP